MIDAATRIRRAARGLGRLARDLAREKAGAALIEFAFTLPILVTLGMYGTELAYMSSITMDTSQVSLTLADNAARLGQSDNSGVAPSISEANVNSVLTGALRMGASYNLAANGKIILSSLERSGTGLQYLHWQRCRGALPRRSKYGVEGAGLTGKVITGAGVSGATVTAPAGSAVMIAEVYYKYPGLFGSMFNENTEFYQQAVMIVRDDRNLTPGVTGTGKNSNCV